MIHFSKLSILLLAINPLISLEATLSTPHNKSIKDPQKKPIPVPITRPTITLPKKPLPSSPALTTSISLNNDRESFITLTTPLMADSCVIGVASSLELIYAIHSLASPQAQAEFLSLFPNITNNSSSDERCLNTLLPSPKLYAKFNLITFLKKTPLQGEPLQNLQDNYFFQFLSLYGISADVQAILLNTLVKIYTQGEVENFFQTADLEVSNLVLFSVLSLGLKWQTPFSGEKTTLGYFHGGQADEYLRYRKGEDSVQKSTSPSSDEDDSDEEGEEGEGDEEGEEGEGDEEGKGKKSGKKEKPVEERRALDLLLKKAIEQTKESLLKETAMGMDLEESLFPRLGVREMPFMNTQEILFYSKQDNFEVFEKPLSFRGMNFFVMLPEEGLDLKDFLSTSPGNLRLVERLEHFKSNKEKRNVFLFLPKFKVTSSVDLRELLISSGVTSVFQSGEGLSGLLVGGGKVSKMNSLSTVEVNETGVSFETGTGGHVFKKKRRQVGFPDKEVRVDRPFIFGVVYKDVVLYVGSFYG